MRTRKQRQEPSARSQHNVSGVRRIEISRPMVLVVEDCDELRVQCSAFLEASGYSVIAASNGEMGLRALDTLHRCDAIVLDLEMPVLNGWTFIGRVQRDPRFATIPIVISSAAHDLRAVAGATAVLRKPYQPEELLETLRSCIPSATSSARW